MDELTIANWTVFGAFLMLHQNRKDWKSAALFQSSLAPDLVSLRSPGGD